MADHDITLWHRGWQEAAFGTPERERLIATLDQRGAGDDRHPALRQRWANNEGLGVETRARNGQHCIACRLRYVLKSSHDHSSFNQAPQSNWGAPTCLVGH